MIAVPTNILKNEVYDRAISLGIKIMKTPSIQEILPVLPEEMKNTIQFMYDSGRHNMVIPYIAEIANKSKNLILLEYLEKKAAMKEFTGNIVTTHQYLMKQNSEFLSKYNIIVDEDILKTIVKDQTEISIYDIEKIFDNNEQIEFLHADKLKRAIEYSETEKYFTLNKLCYNGYLDASIDLPAFFNAEKFYSDCESIYFFRKNELKYMKYVIVSATANEAMYKYYFHDRKVEFYNCKQAEYKGQLIQYYDKTMSRDYVKSNNKVLDEIRCKLGEGIPIITFKGYIDGIKIHFGNSEGCNCYEGKDISVAGTPHLSEFIYKLFALQMGFDINNDDKLHHQEVTYGGYKFWFMTYKNELLRNIQLWLIESELEQSVGRARLLRKDCTVTLYSNFPLAQALLTVTEQPSND